MDTRDTSERLAIIETRVEALPEISKKLDRIEGELTSLRVRVAGVSAGAAFITALAVQVLAKFFGA
jgi:hypothetical protein